MFFEWTGRDDKQINSKRLHQVIRNVHVEALEKAEGKHFALIGFASDEGVRRNKGRIGASKGPNAIRSQLANIADHGTKVIDIGNVACMNHDLEAAQQHLGEHVANLLRHEYTPMILGGGHETLYGHYLGVRRALGENKKIGIINLDAHFDLRTDEQPSSGTMFRQILKQDQKAGYLCIGIQPLANTEQLFTAADELNVDYISEENIMPLERTFAKINAFAKQHDSMMYTICTDVIQQAFAPGVSAPAPFGLEPKIVRAITNHIVTQPNFLSLDVSEVNPAYDIDHRTSRLISYVLADVFLECGGVRFD